MENSPAQIVLDGKFGTSGPLAGPNYSITDGMGTTRGNNLFQSFAQFNLVAGDVATFTGPANIQNILSRVTDGSPSSINGTIRSGIVGANFFFINPSGILFGPNARVDVSGSFAASSANYLKLADGARFVAALDADDSGLSTAPVSAFGFLGNSPGGIAMDHSTISVPNLQKITLVGGNITVDGGTVRSPGGQINVVSVQSDGEVPVDPRSLSVAEFNAAFPQQGQINLRNSAQLNANGTGGGRIVIRSGRLLVDNSKIQANTTSTTAGQGIDIAAVNDLVLVNGAQINSLSTGGRGAGGDINLIAQSIRLDGGGLEDADGNPTTQISTASGSPSVGTGTAKGGDIVIHAGSLELVNSAQISSATFGAGNAGRIEITASSVRLEAAPEKITQIAANTWSGGGNAGDILIRTDNLDILNSATILAHTTGAGNAGRIDIIATSVNMFNSGVITPATFGTGNGGSVNMTADSVLLDASFIQAVTTFDAGDPTAPKGGNSGNISITAGSIDIRNGGQISATTMGSGSGGTINLTADSIRLTGDNGASGSPTGIRAASGQDFGDFVLVGSGNGGDIVIEPRNPGALALSISEGAQISTSTLGSGNGGRIDISGSSLRLSRGGSISSASSSPNPDAGAAGNVLAKVSDSILLTEGGLVTTEAPNADGGNISLTAGVEIRLTDSKITAQAGPGGGGNITLLAPSLIYLLSSEVNAEAKGDGGNVMIDPVFFVMNNSALISRSSSANGGNITILSDYFFQSDSLIDSSAPFGLPGTVSVSAPDLDLSGSLVGLPSNLLDIEAQLRPDCRVRLAANLSSFIVLGRGGLPIAPGGFVPSGMIPPLDEAK